MENLQHTISSIWNVFVTSNLFNFVIFIACFAWIFRKIDIKGIITGTQQKILRIIENAKKEKEEANQQLKDAENAVANLGTELQTILQEAEKSAQVIGDKVMEEAKKQLETIESNATKVIEAEEKIVASKLSKNTSLASIQVAKSHIENVLEQTPSLHEKYINESIDELDNKLDRLIF